MGSENGHSGQFRAPHLPPSSLSASSSTPSSISAAAAPPPASTAANSATGSSGVWGADMHPSAGEFLPQSFSSHHSALPVAAFPAPLAARMFPAQSIHRPDFTQSDRYYPAAASRWGGGAFASGDDYYDGIAEENEGEWAEDALDTYIEGLDNRDGGALGPGYYYDGPVGGGGAACNEDMELEPPAAATFNWTRESESRRDLLPPSDSRPIRAATARLVVRCSIPLVDCPLLFDFHGLSALSLRSLGPFDRSFPSHASFLFSVPRSRGFPLRGRDRGVVLAHGGTAHAHHGGRPHLPPSVVTPPPALLLSRSLHPGVASSCPSLPPFSRAQSLLFLSLHLSCLSTRAEIEESCQRMEEQHMRIMEVDLTCIGDGNGGEQWQQQQLLLLLV
ncbi:unnamed protein product [Closterium sp. Naga37s-1]|nr:unnamed protein product [Closterium sp. Naga37s-1]